MRNLKITLFAIAAVICMCISSSAEAQDKKGGKAVVELDVETFASKIYATPEREYLGKKPAIVDFTATWCGPCQRLAPILEEIAKEYKGKIDVYKVDVDKCRELAQAFGISSIPALMFIPMEGEPQMLIGLRDRNTLKKEVDKILLGK